MAKKQIVTVSGIRPDFIRMSEIFLKLDAEFEHILVHSGQHVDSNLSDVFFKGLKIRQPDFNLGIGGGGRFHYHQLSDISTKIIDLLAWAKLKPDVVMFLGDSNSVLASIVLKKEGYKVAHIEAGMRSYDLRMLEESNRKICDHMSDFLFVYHENYKNNLLKENICADKIHVVGNTIVEVAKKWMSKIGARAQDHILVDIHRPENFRNPERMKAIVSFVEGLGNKTKKPIVWLNFPRAMGLLQEAGISLPQTFQVVPLMGYIEFLTAQRKSFCMVSDSGTAQEESAILGVPVLVPRDFTERWESVQAGNSLMLDLKQSQEELFSGALKFIEGFGTSPNVTWMGSGDTADKIVSILRNSL